ncbi:MAG: insulinase family protein [Candidatus Hydrogenedentes bacterium]|nr:insulinase family protein [Candidatus Hydrogenedentota bacterium]
MRTFFPAGCFLAGILLCAAAGAEWTAMFDAASDDPLKVKAFRLGNGLEIYISENHEEPRVYAEIAVRAGSKDDPDDATGLAHYMEHLLFKGSRQLGTVDYNQEKPLLDQIRELYDARFTEKDPARREQLLLEINRVSEEAARWAIPNELDRVYRALGAKGLNAHTWHEEVVYKVDLPANRLEQWAMIESDRFAHPVFRLFQTELETVYEEMNRALDSKARVIQYAVDAAMFKRHPYGQKPTLGTVEHLKNPCISRLESFYETWYVPNNMAIFLSGDLRADEVMPVIDRCFGAWKARPLPERPRWEDPAPAAREEVRVRFEGEPFVMLAFRTVPRNHPDEEALTAMDMILDNATAGLINLELVRGQRVTAAGSYPLFLNDYGVEYLFGVPKPGQTHEEVERLLLDTVDRVKRGDFEDWLLEAILRDLARREKEILESNEDRVETMRQAWIAYQPWEQARRRLERIAAVTRDDVIRVANTYFSGGYIAGFREDGPRETPKVEKPPLPRVEIDGTRESAFARAVLDVPTRPLEPRFIEAGRDYQRKRDARGLDFIYVRNPVNDLFSLHCVVPVGSYEEPLLSLAAAYVRRAGTDRLSSEDLAREWYRLAAEFSVDAQQHQVIFSVRGLDDLFEPTVRLFFETLWTPRLPDDAYAQFKEIALKQRDDSRKDQSVIARAAQLYNRYGSDSPSLREPSSEDIRRFPQEALRDVLRRALSMKLSVCYSGTLPEKAVREKVESVYPVRGLLDDPPAPRLLRARPIDTPEIYLYAMPEAAQAHILVDTPGSLAQPERNPVSQLFNAYFCDGMAGILFQELREARALAYMAGGRYVTGFCPGDQNLMIGMVQTQQDKTVDALNALLDLLDNMPREPERYAAAREALIQSYQADRVSFRSIAARVLAWERGGFREDPRRAWLAYTKANDTMDPVIAFHREEIGGKPRMISIVGDPGRINRAALEKFGRVREITAADIFVP